MFQVESYLVGESPVGRSASEAKQALSEAAHGRILA